MGKETDRDNKYWRMLSTRLKETRTEMGLSQQELSNLTETDKGKVAREKIAHTERNTQGRKLQVEDLGRIAESLGVSTDYLLGLSNSKESTSSNGLTDKTNEILGRWGNDTLELFDEMIIQFEGKGIKEDLKAYVFVSYVNANVLAQTITSIKSKVEDTQELSSTDIQKVKFLIEYLDYFQHQKIIDYEYIEFLVDKYKNQLKEAGEECNKLLKYNNHKSIQVNFESIEELKTMFKSFEDNILYQLEKSIKASMKDMTSLITEKNDYFKNINKFFEEVN